MIAAPDIADDRLESVDLVVSLLELLAGSPQPRQLGEISRMLDISKSRTHRHLRALMAHNYVRQNTDGGYETGVRLLTLGDLARRRLHFADAARPVMIALRDDTKQAVTASAMIGDAVTIVELVNGHTLVQFAIRPGTVMAAESAHGRIAEAFGARAPELGDIRARGWATAPGRIVTGVNALAAPVFGHDGAWAGTIAIVGSIDAIPADPPSELVVRVRTAADAISERLGWIK